MSKICEICGKSKQFGVRQTFSKRRINRSWSPNIRKVRALVDGSPKRINVCSKCLKSVRVERPM